MNDAAPRRAPGRRWRVLGAIAVVAVGVSVALVVVGRPSVPAGAAGTFLARTTAEVGASAGPIPSFTVDASDVGQECLPRLARGAGWLDLCWEVARLGGDGDPAKDYYLLRVYGSHEGFRWLLIRSQLVGTPGDAVYDVWPDGTYEGACRQEPVTLMVPMSGMGPDDVCGGTVAHLDSTTWSHRLTWTCGTCLAADWLTRAVSLYAVVGVPAGTIPSWDLFADGGT